VFAMRDSCPHRGIPLSYGRLDGEVVECCYHGWRFDACSGQCVEIPSLSSQDKLKVERIFAGHYPCEERDGYVWVYMNTPGTRLPETIPAAPGLTVFKRQIQDHAPFLRAAFACRPGDYWIDGPGAWAVRAPVVVLAKAREHSRESQTIRADSERFPDEPAFAEHEQRAVSSAQENHRGAGDDHDRFRAAEYPHRGRSQREDVVLEPRDGERECGGIFAGSISWRRGICSSCRFRFSRVFGKIFLRHGSGDDDPAGEGLKHNPRLMLIDDADRPAKVVFRAEGQPDRVATDGRGDGASYGWAGDIKMAVVKERGKRCGGNRWFEVHFPSMFLSVDFKGLKVEIAGAPYCRDKYQLQAECYGRLPGS